MAKLVPKVQVWYNPLTPRKFKRGVKRLGLNQREAAELFGVTPEHMSRWCTGKKPIPKIAQLALAALKQAVIVLEP